MFAAMNCCLWSLLRVVLVLVPLSVRSQDSTHPSKHKLPSNLYFLQAKGQGKLRLIDTLQPRKHCPQVEKSSLCTSRTDPQATGALNSMTLPAVPVFGENGFSGTLSGTISWSNVVVHHGGRRELHVSGIIIEVETAIENAASWTISWNNLSGGYIKANASGEITWLCKHAIFDLLFSSFANVGRGSKKNKKKSKNRKKDSLVPTNKKKGKKSNSS